MQDGHTLTNVRYVRGFNNQNELYNGRYTPAIVSLARDNEERQEQNNDDNKNGRAQVC